MLLLSHYTILLNIKEFNINSNKGWFKNKWFLLKIGIENLIKNDSNRPSLLHLRPHTSCLCPYNVLTWCSFSRTSCIWTWPDRAPEASKWAFQASDPILARCELITRTALDFATSQSSTWLRDVPTANTSPRWSHETEVMYASSFSSMANSCEISLLTAFQIYRSLLSATATRLLRDQSIRFRSNF